MDLQEPLASAREFLREDGAPRFPWGSTWRARRGKERGAVAVPSLPPRGHVRGPILHQDLGSEPVS